MPPDKIVESPNLNEEELKARTKALVAEKGSWASLLEARDTLYNTIAPYFDEPERSQHLLPLYSSLNIEETKNLIIGHYGVRGEIVNPLAMIVKMYFQDTDMELPFAEGVTEVLKGFNRSDSELAVFNARTHSVGIALGLAADEQEEGPLENKYQALWRCADEIERWASLNSRQLEVVDQQTITSALYKYRAALMQVTNYVEYASSYMEHQAKQDRITTDAQSLYRV